MTFEGVPWAVGGGAEHSPEVARLLAHVATSGADGIVTSGDLKVLPLATPGGSVRIMKGAAVLPSRAAGGDQQSYAARNLSEDVVAVTATGSGSGRTDMVVLRVEDSTLAGEPWPDPPSAANGPYVFGRVLQNVPSSAIADNLAARAWLASQGYTAIPLAGITLPTSTGTVSSGMIKDLRNLARPRNQPVSEIPAVPNPVTLSSVGVDTVWPGGGPTIDVPAWATHVSVTVLIAGIRVATGYPANGWLHVAATGYPTVRTVGTQFTCDTTPATLVAAGNLADVSLIAGKRVTFELKGYRNDTGGAVGALQTAAYTSIVYNLTFHERAV